MLPVKKSKVKREMRLLNSIGVRKGFDEQPTGRGIHVPDAVVAVYPQSPACEAAVINPSYKQLPQP